MKKNKLISLGSILASSMLLMACAQATSKVVESPNYGGEISNEEKTPSINDDSNEVAISINLRGATLSDGRDEVTLNVRKGTMWRVVKKLVPQIEDFAYPDASHIDTLKYTFDEVGADSTDDYWSFTEDTELYVQIKHKEPATGGHKVNWVNDNGIQPLYSVDDIYEEGEKPYFKGETPQSSYVLSAPFVGWYPTITPIGTEDVTYTALYDRDNYEVIFDYNYNDITVAQKVDAYQGIGHVQPIDDPERKGYQFCGWFNEPECQTPFDFDNYEIIKDGIHIYAKWEKDTTLVRVDPNGGKFVTGGTDVFEAGVALGTTWKDFYADQVGNIEIGTLPEGAASYVYKYYDIAIGDWVELNEESEYVIDSAWSVKAFYTPKEATLSFADDYDGHQGELPGPVTITKGMKWSDIKSSCVIDEASGYHFDHFYIDNGAEEPTVIGDDYVFEDVSEDITFKTTYTVDVEFTNDSTRGVLPYKSTTLLIGTMWDDVRTTYEPTPIDPYQFEGFYVYDQRIGGEYKFIKPTTLDAHYSEPGADSFTNDPWDVFIGYIHDKTWDELIGESSPYHNDYVEHDNTFVGLERTIKVFNNEQYKVRVIDENIDGSLLTFEFEQVIDLALPYSLDSTNNNYQSSFINNYLNNYFISELPDSLQANEVIKPSTIRAYNTELEGVETFQSKLFLLSAKQLGFTTLPDPELMNDDPVPVADEGETYKYYQPTDTNRIKSKTDGTAVSYWTRSPDITGSKETAWNVNDAGGLGQGGRSIATISNNVYFAPAFQIG